MLLLKLSAQSFHIHFTGPIQNENIIAFDIMKCDKFNSSHSKSESILLDTFKDVWNAIYVITYSFFYVTLIVSSV